MLLLLLVGCPGGDQNGPVVRQNHCIGFAPNIGRRRAYIVQLAIAQPRQFVAAHGCGVRHRRSSRRRSARSVQAATAWQTAPAAPLLENLSAIDEPGWPWPPPMLRFVAARNGRRCGIRQRMICQASHEAMSCIDWPHGEPALTERPARVRGGGAPPELHPRRRRAERDADRDQPSDPPPGRPARPSPVRASQPRPGSDARGAGLPACRARRVRGPAPGDRPAAAARNGRTC